MIKTILAILGALFVVFMIACVGAGAAMSHDCSKKTSNQYEWNSCMEDKADSFEYDN